MTTNIESIATLSLADPLIIVITLINLKKLYNSFSLRQWRASYLKKSTTLFFLLMIGPIFSYVNFFFSMYSPHKIELIKMIFAIIYGLNFVFFFSLADESNAEDYLKYTMIGTTIVSITCIFGVVLAKAGIITNWVKYGSRGTGVMHDPNITAIFLTIQLFLMAMYYIKNKNRNTLFCCLICVISIVLTGSKGAVIVLLMLALLSLALLLVKRRFKALKNLILILIFFAFISYVLITQTSIFTTVISRVSSMNTGNLSDTTTGRSELWGMAFHFLKRPKTFLFGLGLGAFSSEVATTGIIVPSNLVHNTFLSIFVETGVFSLIIWMGVFFYTVYYCLKIYLKTGAIDYLLLFLGSVSMVVGMNQVNYQNNRSLYIVLVFFYFIIFKYKNDKIQRKK